MPTTYVPLSSSTLSTAQPSVTFSSISGSYSDLVLVANAQSAQATTYDNLIIQFNSDTGSNYSRVRLNAFSGGVASEVGSNSNSFGIGPITGTSYSSTIFSQSTIQIKGYSNTTTYKTAIWRSNSQNDYVQAGVGTWRNTNAINSITIKTASGSNLAAGSTFALYGIASTTASTPKATGGTITYNGSYVYHTFTSSGTFAPTESVTADILVVAGGGGSMDNSSGGGGAGGLLLHTRQSLSATNYTVTVGAGGSGGTDASSTLSTAGNNSQFASLTVCVGGGRGLGRNVQQPTQLKSGGSGGGGTGAGTSANTSNTGGSGTSGQGNAGGNASAYGETPMYYPAAGGGGAGAAGSAPSSSSTAGAGGSGLPYSEWAFATNTGDRGYYAGGGGGGINSSGQSGSGSGGIGGGGSNGNATVNTGGGGGAKGYPATGGAGGSGIVIVRYQV